MTSSPHRLTRNLVLAAVLAFVLLIQTSTVFAQRAFYWERFDVDMALQRDGSVDITEHQTIVFSGGTYRFGFATIEKNRLDGIRDVSVRKGDVVYQQSSSERPGTFTFTDVGDEYEIYWYFEPTNGHHTWTFSYTVDGMVRVEESGSQILWQAIPADFPARIETSQVTITVPDGVMIGSAEARIADSVDATALQGISSDGRTAEFATAFLTPGDKFEAGIRFPTEQLNLTPPDWQGRETLNDALGFVILLVSLLILFAFPLLVLGAWYTRGRDPDPGLVPEYITEPPSTLAPALVGSLVDERVDMDDIISTIVDLARRGYLRIAEDKRDHVYHLTDKHQSDLKPFERRLITDIFGSSRERKLSTLRYKFADKLPGIRDALYKEMVAQKFFNRSPDATRTNYRAVAMICLVMGGLLFIIVASALSEVATSACLGLAILPGAFVLLYTATHMPRKTLHGAEEAAKWNAFRKYLKELDQHQLKEASEIFNRYLPYAVAFGIERSWIRKFSKMEEVRPPIWYDPYHPSIPRRGRGGRPIIFGSGGSGSPSQPAGEGGGGLPSLDNMSESMTGGLESMSKGLTQMLSSTSTIMRSQQSNNDSSGSFGGGGGGFSGGFSGGSSGGGSRGFG